MLLLICCHIQFSKTIMQCNVTVRNFFLKSNAWIFHFLRGPCSCKKCFFTHVLTVHAVEMSYLRGACGVTRLDRESDEGVYEKCGMGSQANGVNCGVVEWLKRNTLRWFGHIERMGSEELVKKV